MKFTQLVDITNISWPSKRKSRLTKSLPKCDIRTRFAVSTHFNCKCCNVLGQKALTEKLVLSRLQRNHNSNFKSAPYMNL